MIEPWVLFIATLVGSHVELRAERFPSSELCELAAFTPVRRVGTMVVLTTCEYRPEREA